MTLTGQPEPRQAPGVQEGVEVRTKACVTRPWPTTESRGQRGSWCLQPAGWAPSGPPASRPNDPERSAASMAWKFGEILEGRAPTSGDISLTIAVQVQTDVKTSHSGSIRSDGINRCEIKLHETGMGVLKGQRQALCNPWDRHAPAEHIRQSTSVCIRGQGTFSPCRRVGTSLLVSQLLQASVGDLVGSVRRPVSFTALQRRWAVDQSPEASHGSADDRAWLP